MMITIDARRETATLSLEGAFICTADEIINLIQRLAKVRAALRPAVEGFPEKVSSISDTEPEFFAVSDDVLGDLTIMFRSPGLGWLSAKLSHESVELLTTIFERHLELRSRGGRH